MGLFDISNLSKKYKEFSDNLNLDEKLSKVSDVIEEKYTEISDALDLDEKFMKASNSLDDFGRKCAKVSDALGLDEKLMKVSDALDLLESHIDARLAGKNTGSARSSESLNRGEFTDKDVSKASDLTKGATKARKNCITCKKYWVKGKNPTTNRFKTTQVVVESTASMETVQQKSGFLPPFEITEASLGAPTEKQIAYAKKLKLSLPQDAAFEDVSIFLTRYEEGKTLYPSPMPEKLIRYLIGKGIYVPAYAGEDEAHNLYFRNIDLDEKIAYFAMKVHCNLKRKVYYTLEDAEPEMKDLFYLFAMKYKDNKEFIKSLSYYSGSDLPLNSYAISKKLKAYDMAVDFFIK